MSLSRVLGLRRLFLADPPQDLGIAGLAGAARARAASSRSAARRAARPARRCRCGCRCPWPSISACSGLMYSSVPTIAPCCVKSVCSVSRWSIALAMPKSITLGTGLPSCSATSTFDGLMSRWMIPFWWACWIAWQTGMNSSRRSRGVRLRVVAVLGDRDALDQLHHEVRAGRCRWRRRRGPWRCSGGPSAPAPAARPRSGRRPARVSMPGLMTLSATVPSDGLRLLGQVDGAHAALADLLRAACRGRRRGRALDDGATWRRRGRMAGPGLGGGREIGGGRALGGRHGARVGGAALRRGRLRDGGDSRSGDLSRKLPASPGPGGRMSRPGVGRPRSLPQARSR